MTLDTAIQDFLDAKSLRAAKTVEHYRSSLHLYRDYIGPHWPPTEITIVKFLGHHKAKGNAEATVHAHYRALRCWLNWLHKRGRIDDNPILLVDEPGWNRLLPRAPKPEDVKSLLDHLNAGRHWRDIRDGAMFTLALDTGMRVGELVALNLSDIDLSLGQIEVQRSKGKRGRIVVFSGPARASLTRWLTIRSDLATHRALFISWHRGAWRRLTHWGVRHALSDRQDQAGVARFKLHSLRHAYALYSIRAKADIIDVQHQLGHASLTTTARYLMADGHGRGERHANHSPLSYIGGAL